MDQTELSDTDVDEQVVAAAKRLLHAASSRVPCGPVRDLIGASDVERAYLVQTGIIEAKRRVGERVVGQKIGLTSEAVQRQLGVDQPDFGTLLATMRADEVVYTSHLLQPRVEAEVAFVLRSDLLAGPFTLEQCRDAVDYATAALEIVDSRIIDWDITIADTIADNGSSAMFVLGPQRIRLDDFKPHEVTMTMSVNGEIVSHGTGRDCLGDPLSALTWLANAAYEMGSPLRSGYIILSGALGPMVDLPPSGIVEATIAPLGDVSVLLTTEETR